LITLWFCLPSVGGRCSVCVGHCCVGNEKKLGKFVCL